jgi:hypothetical protein
MWHWLRPAAIPQQLPSWARPLYVVSHPLAIFPIAILVAGYFGSYEPQHINGYDVPLFLQGSTDMGGSDTFAATIAMYIAFGLLGAVYVILQMHVRRPTLSYVLDVGTNLWALRFHIFFFILGGTACWDYDERVTPNDFRNMFLFAILVYSASVAIVTAVGRTRLPLHWRLAFAPLAIYAWLWLGADGNTMKAGQTRQSGEDPLFQPRGTRHRIMLAWHQLCDEWLGDR